MKKETANPVNPVTSVANSGTLSFTCEKPNENLPFIIEFAFQHNGIVYEITVDCRCLMCVLDNVYTRELKLPDLTFILKIKYFQPENAFANVGKNNFEVSILTIKEDGQVIVNTVSDFSVTKILTTPTNDIVTYQEYIRFVGIDVAYNELKRRVKDECMAIIRKAILLNGNQPFDVKNMPKLASANVMVDNNRVSVISVEKANKVIMVTYKYRNGKTGNIIASLMDCESLSNITKTLIEIPDGM